MQVTGWSRGSEATLCNSPLPGAAQVAALGASEVCHDPSAYPYRSAVRMPRTLDIGQKIMQGRDGA